MLTVNARDVSIPALGLGTWQLTGSQCREGVEHAIGLGYRHIDTAQMYGNEDEVGRGTASAGVDRGELFVTTKLADRNCASERVRSSVEDSLRRLGTDYIDLLLIHWPNEDVELAETLDAMCELQHVGVVRNLGVSNFPPSWVKEAVDHAPILANQVEYHPYLSQDEQLELAEQHDFALTAYSPLARGEVLDDEVLVQIAEAHGATPAQVALAWLLQQPRVCAIPKAASAAHREGNLGAVDIELSDDEMRRIFTLRRGRRIIDPGFAPDWER